VPAGAVPSLSATTLPAASTTTTRCVRSRALARTIDSTRGSRGRKSPMRAARIAASPKTADRKSDSARRSTVSASGINRARTTAVRT
jgi:hypothetical protein